MQRRLRNIQNTEDQVFPSYPKRAYDYMEAFAARTRRGNCLLDGFICGERHHDHLIRSVLFVTLFIKGCIHSNDMKKGTCVGCRWIPTRGTGSD